MVKGTVIQFRRGRHTIHERHFILDVGTKDREEAKSFVGKEVSWKSSADKEIKGKISSPHGNKGLVRAIFEKGLPGQAINEEVNVSIVETPKDLKEKPKKAKKSEDFSISKSDSDLKTKKEEKK